MAGTFTTKPGGNSGTAPGRNTGVTGAFGPGDWWQVPEIPRQDTRIGPHDQFDLPLGNLIVKPVLDKLVKFFLSDPGDLVVPSAAIALRSPA